MIKMMCRIITIYFFPLLFWISETQAQEIYPGLKDITQQVGVEFIHSIGDNEMSNLVESNAGGCAFFDYDNDEDLDIYLVNGA
jgi:hypothetical protein